VVCQVIKTGCQAVPKSDLTDDQFCWRLSFSRGEQVLSKHVPPNARLAFLAVKLAWKQRFKQACEKLKSYHLKTIFYHFLENSDQKAMENASFDVIYRSFIRFLLTYLRKKEVPHFFIRSVNLMEKSPLTNEELENCETFFRTLLEKDIQDAFGRSSKNEIMIYQLKENHYFLFILIAIILLIINCVGVCIGIAAYFILLLLILSLLICFLYSSVIYLPVLATLYLSYKVVEYCKHKKNEI